MWIMMIDDDEEDIEFFREVLMDCMQDYRCISAFTCEKGLLRIRDTDELPSHIFLDGMLYGMSSKECLLKIKSDARIKDVKVVMYSGFLTIEQQAEFKKLGADVFLQKPVDKAELVSALRRILQCT